MALVRLFRGSVVFIVGLVAVVAILVLALNFYLGWAGTAALLQTRLSAALDLPITCGNLSVNVLKGATFSNLRAENPASKGAPILLTAPTAEIDYSPQALLRHRFLVRQFILPQPAFKFEIGPEGHLIFPTQIAGPLPDFFSGLRWTIKSLSIRDGTVQVVDAFGGTLLQIDGLTHGGRFERRGNLVKASGQFSAHTLMLGPFQAGNWESSYDYADGTLSIPKWIATAYHGQWTGSLQMHAAPATQPFPYEFELQASAVDLNEMLKSIAAKPNLLSGILSLTLSGNRSPSGETTGQGNFDIHGGQLIRVNFIEELAIALGVKELSQPDFTTCHGEVTIDWDATTGQPSQISIAALNLQAANFTLTGSGTIHRDGALKLALQMTFLPDVLKSIPPAIVAQFTPGQNGTKSFSFNVTGTLDDPKSDIPNRLTGLGLLTPPMPAPVAPVTP